MTFSTIFFVAIIVAVIYNAEKLPQMMNKLKDEMPHIVDASKKASKELKEKAQAIHKEKMNAQKTEKDEENKE